MNEPNSAGSLRERCEKLEHGQPLTSRQILEPFDLLSGHPWAETAGSDITNYYSCLYGIAQPEQPRKILEIGTAFGMSAATFLTASPGVELFVSLDLGIYGEQLGGEQGNNIRFARQHIHQWSLKHSIDPRRVRFYQANTQPVGIGDNSNLGLEVSRWSLIPEVVRLLEDNQFDIIFVDGKHTDDGLLNDLRTFWPFLKPGGLAICDDLHEPNEYAGAFSWVGQTWQAYHRFLEEAKSEIVDHCLWNFPRVPPATKLGLRPFGVIRKTAETFPKAKGPAFSTFDSEDAMAINRARQDHLASFGLDLANRSVLEVGAGVGWHTAFFERLGCRVLSTDARPENMLETQRRYPYRNTRVQRADLTQPGSHASFGEFDIVYCYGTLYHLKDPALCLAELSRASRHLLLLETIVNPEDNGQTNPAAEDRSNPNQSFHGQGCRPGRDWVMNELRRHFPHVYVSKTQPAHKDFAMSWPAKLKPGVQNARSIFVASREPLDLPSLSTSLASEQTVLTSVLAKESPVPSNGKPSPEDTVGLALRERIGRLMGLRDAASSESILAADEFIARFLQSDRPGELVADRTNPVPRAVPALLMDVWGQALRHGQDELQVQNLERLYGFMSNARQSQLVHAGG